MFIGDVSSNYPLAWVIHLSLSRYDDLSLLLYISKQLMAVNSKRKLQHVNASHLVNILLALSTFI